MAGGQGQDRLYAPWWEGDRQRLGRQWGHGRDAEPGVQSSDPSSSRRTCKKAIQPQCSTGHLRPTKSMLRTHSQASRSEREGPSPGQPPRDAVRRKEPAPALDRHGTSALDVTAHMPWRSRRARPAPSRRTRPAPSQRTCPAPSWRACPAPSLRACAGPSQCVDPGRHGAHALDRHGTSTLDVMAHMP
ncbi:unnamed protein product [Rangifer tarandus platyrhynchus]|uniref:Uncharacterized protein n=2 Tax=Rangifer tarandus platyrhynchus TaxID=3082113 RepID=A0ABN8YER0_RANTA|nr:unnamed protein product [Rangifer tarandus platyrhynchus]CAI9699554.1 unnamed protein product [Rangifer tarandus platyrhynchus]